jgi:hypothetical protein
MGGFFIWEKFMTKPTTVWRPNDGNGDVAPTNKDDFLLLENGDNILQESGDELLLNETVVTPKPATVWEEA